MGTRWRRTVRGTTRMCGVLLVLAGALGALAMQSYSASRPAASAGVCSKVGRVGFVGVRREGCRSLGIVVAHGHDVRRVDPRSRWLSSSVAKAQRSASLMAFHGLGASGAERLLRHDFYSHLSAMGANPAASLASKGRVVRYLGDRRALVRTSHGLQVDSSSVPLRVAHGASAPQPVSLRLRAAGATYAAANPLRSVSVSRNLAGGVTVGSAGIRLVPQGADVSGGLVGGQSVFFPILGRMRMPLLHPLSMASTYRPCFGRV